MRFRRDRTAAATFVIVLLTACSGNPSPATHASAEDELRAATARYAELVRAMDSAAIAALFTVDGEVAVGSQPPVVGRDAIRRQLESFKDYHVIAETLTAETIAVAGTTADVSGSYEQTVRVPQGDVVTVHGAYTARWVRIEGRWHIRRMLTTPA